MGQFSADSGALCFFTARSEIAPRLDQHLRRIFRLFLAAVRNASGKSPLNGAFSILIITFVIPNFPPILFPEQTLYR